MKKAITMILAITLAITAVAPSNKANAEGVPETPAYTPTTAPAYVPATPTPTQKPPEKERIYGSYGAKADKFFEDGETAQVTKGFTSKLEIQILDYDGPILWTSSRPDIATVDANGVVTGKKYGKTKITVNYGGTTSYIYMEVVKNEYSRKLYMASRTDAYKTYKYKEGDGITSARFDKKGNLKIVFSAMRKVKKSDVKKAKKDSMNHPGSVDAKLGIWDNKGKLVWKKKINNKDADNYCCTKKTADCHTGININPTYFYHRYGINKPVQIRFTIKKKDLKGKLKNVDLRTGKVAIVSWF